MKKIIKVYIEADDYSQLVKKAEASGFRGRGAVSHYISKISREPICFLSEDVRNLLKALNLK